MFYILYEVRNNLNGKIYVGVHKTKDINDGYMGSGKVICAAIAKYGIENFTKRILEQFDNAAAMFAREKEVVTDEFLLREDVYNLRRGGTGGFDYINKNMDEEYRRIRRENGKKIPDSARSKAGKISGKLSANNKTGCHSERFLPLRKTISLNGRLAAKTSSAIQKKKNTFAQINHQQGEKNSQFGKMYVTNGIENTKILKDSPIPEGWYKGRTGNK